MAVEVEAEGKAPGGGSSLYCLTSDRQRDIIRLINFEGRSSAIEHTCG